MDIIEILKEHFADHLTPEIEGKIKTSFELAISEKVSDEKEKIKETLEEELKTEVATIKADLIEKLDTYIEKANDELIDEHLKDVESKSKVELAENLVSTIIKSLKENDMNIAIEDKDIITNLEEENRKLEKSLNESLEAITESKKQELEYEKAISINEMCSELTDVQKEKIISMVEHVVVDNIEDFKSKVKVAIDIVKEKKIEKEEDLNESFDGNKDEPKDTDQYVPNFN